MVHLGPYTKICEISQQILLKLSHVLPGLKFIVKFHDNHQAFLEFFHADRLVGVQTDVKKTNRHISTVFIANSLKETDVSEEISA